MGNSNIGRSVRAGPLWKAGGLEQTGLHLVRRPASWAACECTVSVIAVSRAWAEDLPTQGGKVSLGPRRGPGGDVAGRYEQSRRPK